MVIIELLLLYALKKVDATVCLHLSPLRRDHRVQGTGEGKQGKCSQSV